VRAMLLLALSLGSLSGCDDECESLPPTFQLDLRGQGGARSIEVVLDFGGLQRSRVFNLGTALDDGETSLVVELDPAVTAEFHLDVAVVAYSDTDASGDVVQSAQSMFDGTPNGCNRFEMQLGGPPPDGGVPDGGADECCGPDCRICDLSCDSANVCNLDCASSAECAATCTGGSACEVLCDGTEECKARCNGGANCRLVCANSEDCGFDVCGGSQMDCSDGSIVCNRPCP
jgi:hypothetical protein